MTSIENNIQKISSLIGAENVIQDQESLHFYSTDIFGTSKEQAIAVVRPGTADELISLIKLCIENEVTLSTRGGGASYTSSFPPARKDTVIIDSQRLKKIEVNEEDMFVTVEPGVTWLELYETLKPLGLRTPHWGPFSGRVATIAGSMSFHAISHGTNNAVSADSLSSLQIITGTGEIIETGSQ